MFNCFAELGPYQYQMYALNITLHRQHVLNCVSGIKKAPNVDCLQCSSLKIICYIQGMFLKKKNEVSVIFSNFVLLCYSDLKTLWS